MAQGDGIFANRRLSGRAAFLAAVALTAMTAPAMAGVTDFTIFRSSENEQTGPSSSTNLFYYFSSFADVDSTSDYTSATLTAPTSTVYSMSGPNSGPPAYWIYSSPGLTKASLDSTYPSGDYTLNATGASDVSVTLDYTGTDEYASPPLLTPTSYDGLNGLDPSAGYTFSFGAFSPPDGYLGIIFFTLTDLTTGTVAYSTSTEDLMTTSFYVPGSDFAPDNSYVEELVFSTRDEISDPTCVGAEGQCPSLGEIGWDSRTEAFFTTGVPEPSTWVMMLIGFGGLSYAAFRRGAKAQTAAAA
jgi:PEP-CTERM motif